jgi:membrane-bound lytic murein transglycosylase A
MKKIIYSLSVLSVFITMHWGAHLTHVALVTEVKNHDNVTTPSCCVKAIKETDSAKNNPSSADASPQTVLKTHSFANLPGWDKADTLTSLKTFQASCRLFVKQSPDAAVGSEFLAMRARDWQPACHAALDLKHPTSTQAKDFFQAWFKPVEFHDGKPIIGLFTGYYFPSVEGSLVKTNVYSVPIYGLPRDRVTASLRDFDASLPNRTLVGRIQSGKLVPYHARKAISRGAIRDMAPIIAWVKTPLDRLILEIEGSGIVTLPQGEPLFLGYAGGNGAPYTAIGRVLIEKGVMTRDNASMQRIRAYLESHPSEMSAVINKNQSFVFFRILTDQKGALGAQGLLLTAGYSLAVDRAWVPLGTPVWLQTTRPDEKTEKTHTFSRLMIAQDTGGAIKGAVRGDVFWGAGEHATAVAGKMKHQGRYWLLLPLTYQHN